MSSAANPDSYGRYTQEPTDFRQSEVPSDSNLGTQLSPSKNEGTGEKSLMVHITLV